MKYEGTKANKLEHLKLNLTFSDQVERSSPHMGLFAVISLDSNLKWCSFGINIYGKKKV